MVGTLSQFTAKPLMDPELSPLDKDILGGDIRLSIPLSGRYQMRNMADLLRGYAARIDFLTHNHDLDDRTVLFNLKFEAKLLNKRIREVCDLTGKAKAPKPYRRNNVT